jgi:hypothetical protein
MYLERELLFLIELIFLLLVVFFLDSSFCKTKQPSTISSKVTPAQKQLETKPNQQPSLFNIFRIINVRGKGGDIIIEYINKGRI